MTTQFHVHKQTSYALTFFNDRATAYEFRREQGGFIFHSDNGDFIHFPYTFTPTRIMLHPATHGQSGEIHCHNPL